FCACSTFAHVSIPIAFEPNYGQIDPETDFVARASGYTVALQAGHADFLTRGSHVSASLLGARRAKPEAEEPLPGLVSYLVGSPSRGITFCTAPRCAFRSRRSTAAFRW